MCKGFGAAISVRMCRVLSAERFGIPFNDVSEPSFAGFLGYTIFEILKLYLSAYISLLAAHMFISLSGK